jgi:hypothetical protein
MNIQDLDSRLICQVKGRLRSRPTARVTGGWGEKGRETGNCHRSEPTPKNAQSPSRPVHALLAHKRFYFKFEL